MTADEIKRLQTRLGVGVDGIIGRGTLAALFAKMDAKPAVAAELALGANVHFRTYGILDSALNLVHFCAQVGHESGGFKWMEEIASGADYEGRADLGNTQPGDGKRFKGRGPLQVTGRGNYRTIGREIGIDLESHPEIAGLPSIGIWTACIFWKNNGLNGWADADNLLAVSNGVNRGNPRSDKIPNGYEDRKAWRKRMGGLIL